MSTKPATRKERQQCFNGRKLVNLGDIVLALPETVAEIAVAPITVRPIQPPVYQNAPITLANFERWFICNERELRRYWAELGGDRAALDDFLPWTQCQYDVANIAAADDLRSRLRNEREPREESLRDYERREFD